MACAVQHDGSTSAQSSSALKAMSVSTGRRRQGTMTTRDGREGGSGEEQTSLTWAEVGGLEAGGWRLAQDCGLSDRSGGVLSFIGRGSCPIGLSWFDGLMGEGESGSAFINTPFP